MREKILTFMKLTNMDQAADNLVEFLVGRHRAEMQTGFEGEIPPAPKKALELIEGALREKRGQVVEHIMKCYEKTFTESEIDDFISFYESPTGKRFVEASANLQNEIGEFGNTWHLDVMNSIQVELAKIFE